MLDILMILLIFNPIISVVLDFNFDYYRFTGPVMTVIFFMLLYKNKKHRTKLMVFTGCLAIMSILALIGYYSIGKIFNHILWYVNFCFIMYIFSEEEYIHAFLSKVKNYVNYLLYMVIACNIIELLFMITGWGFKKIWEGRYFQGTNNMPHELAYLMLVLVVITFIIFRLTNKKLVLLNLIIPTVAIALSGARSPFGALLIIYAILIGMYIKPKYIAYGASAAAIVCVIFNKQFAKIPMVKKFMRQIKYKTFSSGRTKISKAQLDKFKSKDFFHKLFGMGDDRVYQTNLVRLKQEIWAHNDFVQVLVGKGIIGLLIYIYVLTKYTWSLIKNSNVVFGISILFIIIFMAVTNGFYSYRDITFAIPYFSIFVMLYSNNRTCIVGKGGQ